MKYVNSCSSVNEVTTTGEKAGCLLPCQYMQSLQQAAAWIAEHILIPAGGAYRRWG